VTGLSAIVTGWDRAAFHAVNLGLSCPAMDRIMPWITDLGLGHVQVGALMIGALAAGWARTTGANLRAAARLRLSLATQLGWVLPALIGMLIAGLGSQVLKRVYRERPSWFYVQQQRAGRGTVADVHIIVGRRPLRVNGFPSGHTATTAALAVVLGVRLPTRRGRRTAALALGVMTALVALSRVYIADHWPLDVLGGAALGAASGLLAARAAVPCGSDDRAKCGAGAGSAP
jgi:membrane-associated phospholipid phosphatase